MAELPVVCTLTPEARSARREGLLLDLVRRAARRSELTDGHRLEFAAAGDTLSALARAVDAERRCCRFLRFRITVEPDAGPIVLEMTGPPGTREFMGAVLEE
jgi:hypothetical protein